MNLTATIMWHSKTIGELPTPELRLAACKRGSEILGLNVQFGVKLGLTNKLKRSEIENDKTGLLSLRGDQLPLKIFKSQ